MAAIRLNVGGTERALPLPAQTILGRDHAVSTWRIGPPLFPTAPQELPTVWLELRWSEDRSRWLARRAGAGLPGGWSPVEAGDHHAAPGITLDILDTDPPTALAIRVSDNAVRTGRQLAELVQRKPGGWFTREGCGPLNAPTLIVADGQVWRFHPGSTELWTGDPDLDLLSPDTRLRFDLSGPVPVLEVEGPRRTVRICSRTIWAIVPYAREREAGDGWLNAEQARRFYANEVMMDEDEVRPNRLAEDRRDVLRRLSEKGVTNSNELFERQDAGRRTVIRLRVCADRLDLA